MTSQISKMMDSHYHYNDIVANVTLQMTMMMELTAVRLFAEGAVLR